MNLEELIARFKHSNFFNELLNICKSQEQKAAICLPDNSSRSLIYCLLGQELNQPLLIITSSMHEAKIIREDIRLFTSQKECPLIFPSPDHLAYETSPVPYGTGSSPEIIGQRLKVLSEISEDKARIIIAPDKALLFKTSDLATIKKQVLRLKNKGDYALEEIIQLLIETGYKRQAIVGEAGEFALRGGILDIFPSNLSQPARIEFSANKIESIRLFNPNTQRSIKTLEEIEVLGINEQARICLLESLSPKTMVILHEPEKISLSLRQFFEDLKETKKEALLIGTNNKISETISDKKEFEGLLDNFKQLKAGTALAEGSLLPKIISAPNFNKNLDQLLDFINQNEHLEFFIFSKHAEHVREFMQKPVLSQTINRGFIFEDIKAAIICDQEIFGEDIHKQKKEDTVKEGVNQELLANLAINDYVVHENYGIGIYRGLESLQFEDTKQEYLLVEYAENDKLYVPLHQMGLVSRYSQSGAISPKINRLGTKTWENIKTRAKTQIRDLAKDLLELYAYREKERGFSFAPDTIYQKELEESFAFEETPDQLKAIEEITRDMQSCRPMDRLLCGDVGYGKTEVALRAAALAAANGKQVSILAPTTILAHQHYSTFRGRLTGLPLKVEVISRFRSKKEQAQIKEELKNGTIDIIVGTHRLLQKDVSFKDLGLVIVDEEQHFGVLHKERLKTIKKNTDVLTLSATPIPRTLYFSLSGIRDMSIINTPPLDRMPIRTNVLAFSENLIREAMRREVDRGGQIYFVHNFVHSINRFAQTIRKLAPEIRVRVAHGQMHEHELEKTMVDFLEKKFDCLICTTIIESGLDMPNVNTILIDEADRFGLSQLYQLRGRVGRSSARAYAYLMYYPEKIRKEAAYERLKAITDFTALGSGYQVALRDLEIRGAGSLLGAQQHGHLLAVGFDLYCQLIEEVSREIKGTPLSSPKQISLDIKLNAFIPDNYIDDERQRISIYRRMSVIEKKEDLKDLENELADRFGALPSEMKNLLALILLKLCAAQNGIKKISLNEGQMTIELEKEAEARQAQRKLKHFEHAKKAGNKFHVFVNTAKPLKIVNELIGLLSNS